MRVLLPSIYEEKKQLSIPYHSRDTQPQVTRGRNVILEVSQANTKK